MKAGALGYIVENIIFSENIFYEAHYHCYLHRPHPI